MSESYLLYTLDPGVGTITFEALVAFIVTIASIYGIKRRSKDWPEALRLHVGLGLLSLWFITHWIDTVVTHAKPAITPYFLIFTIITHILKISSDVLIITGLWRIIIRYDFLRPLKVDLSADTLFASLLWVLAGVHIVLYISATGLLISGGHVAQLNRVARARSAFEIAYLAVQFVAALVMCVYACCRAKDRKADYLYFAEFGYMAHAAVALLLRSFCEIVIVGQLDRRNDDIFDSQRARNVLYGLCSIYLVWMAVYAVPGKGKDDPLVMKDNAAVEEIKTLVEGKIAEVVDGGRNTAPTMSKVLNGIEADLRAQTVAEDDQQEHIMKLNEIARLRKQYVNWEPVVKSESNMDEQNDIIELVERNDRTLEGGTQSSGLGRMIKQLWPRKTGKKEGEKQKVVDVELEDAGERTFV